MEEVPAFSEAPEIRKKIRAKNEGVPLRSPVEEDRMVFTICTYRMGWSLTRTGNYLGVTRQRVLQLIDSAKNRYPELVSRSVVVGDPRFDVRVSTSRWDDADFRRKLVGT